MGESSLEGTAELGPSAGAPARPVLAFDGVEGFTAGKGRT